MEYREGTSELKAYIDISEFRKEYTKYVFFTGQTNIDKI